MKSNLVLDWASHKAARYACQNWHYTGVMPPAGCKIGVWENGQFIGVVLFGFGAGASTRGTRYGLKRKGDVAELVRVALREHQAPVSRIIKIALKMLKESSPNIRLVISFADEMGAGHHGGIYQAGNWVYAGTFEGDGGFQIHGKPVHSKTVHSRGWKQSVEWLRDHVDPECKKLPTRKHRYLMPMDKEMRDVVASMAQPYPKRVKQAASIDQMSGRRGSTDPHAPKTGT